MVWKRPLQTSQETRRLCRLFSLPDRNLRASPAASDATRLTTGPRTPMVSQVSSIPAAPAEFIRQARHAVCPGRITIGRPELATAAEEIQGVAECTAKSLIRKRVSKLSVP